MKNFCQLFKFAILVQAALFVVTAAYGVAVDTGKGPDHESGRKLDRVRIPIKLTPYHKILVKTKEGKLEEKQLAAPSMTHTFRARMERTNHFYVGSWHVETVPLKWESQQHRYQVRVRFFERLGAGQEIEEYVGNVDANGVLVKENDTFNFKGFAAAEFKTPAGANLLDIEIGQSKTPAAEPLLSKSIPQTP